MSLIIIGTVLLGCLFYVYVIIVKNRRQDIQHVYSGGVDDRPRVIQLPKDLEKEKRRRHIH